MSGTTHHTGDRPAGTLPRALLVACKLPDMADDELSSSLDELGRLVTTLGFQLQGRLTQTRQSLAPAAVLGEGKLEELKQLTGVPPEEAGDMEYSPLVDLVAVDHDLTPTQLRNLEQIAGTRVLDRTGVIIEIFHRHARSREARLQVEIARLTYEAPRLRESPRGHERQAGRGAGDSALEIDRRRVRDRISELRQQLDAIQRLDHVRRAQRQDLRRVALVGYTNAGKSSLMRALTGSDVYVEDKLFATLDTTVRALSPETRPRTLVSDTVGFIKKLPHDLVASFKSTLDEALEASLLLHVVDASDPQWRSEYTVTREVLEEIGALEVPLRLVMNKIDRLSPGQLAEFKGEHPDAWFISAKDSGDVAWVREQIIEFFEGRYEEAELLVPYGQQKLVAEMHEQARVLSEHYDEQGVTVRVRGPKPLLDSLRSRLA